MLLAGDEQSATSTVLDFFGLWAEPPATSTTLDFLGLWAKPPACVVAEIALLREDKHLSTSYMLA